MDTTITLEQLLDSLCRGKGLHVCIHDISGILQHPNLKLPRKYILHSSAFCDAAKATAISHRICMRCKMITNEKASRKASWFQGYCCYGIYKVVYPVVINDRVACIIYLGNLVDNPKTLQQRIRKMCHYTGVLPENLIALIDTLETVTDDTLYYNIARIIASHIQSIGAVTNDLPSEQTHWAVSSIKQYVEENYTQEILLKDIAKLYYVNHQYIGRLFKEQELLACPGRSITDIAMDCGFQTVTYFNRLFQQRYKTSPQKYRKAKIPHPL